MLNLKNYFLVASTIFVAFIMLGCAAGNPKVHLYAKYLSEQEKQGVTQKLEELGFATVANTLDFPINITEPSIIYSLMLEEEENVDLLVNGMQSIGINIMNIEALVSGNHWQTKNSLALFLISSDSNTGKRVLMQDLVETYKSMACENTIELNLNRNGTYQLIGEVWTDEQLPLSKGKWEYRQYPYVELRPEKGESWYRYYEITELVEEDQVSKINILKLTPLESHQLAGTCSFVFGIRQ